MIGNYVYIVSEASDHDIQVRMFTLSMTYELKFKMYQQNPMPVNSSGFELIYCICLTSLTRAKCGVRSTLCWKIPNISGSIELFAL